MASMIRSIGVITLLLLCTIPDVIGAEAMLRRTTLLVQDVEQSKAFYQALGFREWLDWSEDQDPEALTGLPLNSNPSHARMIIMAGEDPYIGMIGLLEYSGPPLKPSRPQKAHLRPRSILATHPNSPETPVTMRFSTQHKVTKRPNYLNLIVFPLALSPILD
jgi:catechol 2,3-dioxygenase-like lactoylglutathione lyase family enzyme